MFETRKDAQMNLRRVSNLQVTLQKMTMIICLQIPTVSQYWWKTYFWQLPNENVVNDAKTISYSCTINT
jgi:hypothetical protein